MADKGAGFIRSGRHSGQGQRRAAEEFRIGGCGSRRANPRGIHRGIHFHMQRLRGGREQKCQRRKEPPGAPEAV